MQTGAMLLRSSSSPLLDCLLAHPFSHTEPSPDAKHEGNIKAAEAPPLFCAPLHASRGGPHLSPSSHSSMHLDSHFAPAKLCSQSSSSDQSTVALVSPSNRIRKVQSENDLCSVGGGDSFTPARLAANTLLQDSLVDDYPPGSTSERNSSCLLPRVKMGRTSLPLCRWRSLGSRSSELSSVFLSCDSNGSEFSILEEGESSASSSSAKSETEEDGGREIFDKIALPVGEAVYSKQDGGGLISNMHDKGKSSGDASEEDILQWMAVGQRAPTMPTGFDQVDMVASSSGRQGLDSEFRQCPTVFTSMRLARGVGEPTSPLKYMYDGDTLETAYSGGDGGRGARPPTITTGGGFGGGGGGGDAGGCGGSSEVADQHYQHMLQKDPGNPLLLRNYAQYLADVKHDYRKSEEFFQRAILASPSDGELLGQYAKLLWEVKHDSERAADYFERAVQAAPDNSYVMAAHASFLWSSEEEQETSESSPSDFPSSLPSLVSAGLA